jgi:hypothetical protein
MINKIINYKINKLHIKIESIYNVMDKYNHAYNADDYAYDADNEYDVDDDENNYPEISRQTFIDIGDYIVQLWNEPRTSMDRVIAELVDLHACKENNEDPTTHTMIYVGECRQQIRSVSSELFSLCSNETDETVFKYYISDDEINVELT